VLATVAAAALFALVAANGALEPIRLALFLGSVLLTQMAISAWNDYCDRDLDAVAKPWRPIPAGLISGERARLIAAALVAVGLALSAPLGWAGLALGSLGTSAGFAYSTWFKRTSLSWLPFWVGFPTLALWACATVERWEPRLLAVYLLGLPLVLALHFADTLPDLIGDAGGGVRGLAHRLGPVATRAAIGRLLVASLLLGAVLGAHVAGLLAGAAGALGTSILLILRRDRLVRYGAAATATAVGLGWLGSLG
jgi:4-hydroxybenzoate polyprenyltransferase